MITQQEAAGYYYDRFRHKLVALAAKKISRRRIDRCHDLVQATFVEFMCADVRAIATGELCSPDTDKQCWTYLVRILGSKCARFKQGLQDQRDSTSEEDVANLTTTLLSATEILEQKEQHDQLRQALGLLEPRDREIMISHFVNGDTYEEIAARFDIGCGTIGSILHRVKGKLLTRLRPYLEDGRRMNRLAAVGDERRPFTQPPGINPDDPFK